MQDVVERQKREAAARALAFVEPGMRLGLGTGTTAKHFVALLGEKVAAGLQVVGVPTSEATRAQAESLSIPLATLDEVPALDITVDGADEVGPDLVLIKGGGGALLREKIVASASARMIVIADASKWVSVLGGFPLPIEVVPFGFSAVLQAIEKAITAAGCRGRLEIRRTKDGHPFVTDGGHWIVDAALGRITDPTALATRLDGIAGVVDHGLFIGLADTVILAGPDGARLIEKAGRTTPGERE
jgi:ribose 5-phosphate isomerase A